MSTIKLCFSIVLAIGFGLASPAWSQTDSPPAPPNWSEPPASLTKPVFPELSTRPAAATPAPAVSSSRPFQASRPARLSSEVTAGLPSHVQNVIDFYGGATSGRALSQLPNRPSSGAVRPPQPRQKPKPFQGTVAGAPTLSPYLNLFADENNEALPNYHAFVRPRIQQQAYNSTASRELNRLESRVQTASYGEAVAPTSGSVPGTGHGTRYFNTTRFYPTTRRLR